MFTQSAYVSFSYNFFSYTYVKSFSKLYDSTIWTSVCRTPKTLYKLLFWGSFWGLLVLNSELEKSVAHFTNYHPGTQKSIINTACIFSHSFGWKYIITLNNDYLVLWLLIISNVHSLLSFIISKAIITVSKNIYLIDYWMYTQVCTVWPVCLIVSSEKIQLVRVLKKKNLIFNVVITLSGHHNCFAKCSPYIRH